MSVVTALAQNNPRTVSSLFLNLPDELLKKIAEEIGTISISNHDRMTEARINAGKNLVNFERVCMLTNTITKGPEFQEIIYIAREIIEHQAAQKWTGIKLAVSICVTIIMAGAVFLWPIPHRRLAD